jgi:hypothetical protein
MDPSRSTSHKENPPPSSVHINKVQLPQEDVNYLRHKHIFCKTETSRNHHHQNIVVTWTQVKTLNKQQTYI